MSEPIATEPDWEKIEDSPKEEIKNAVRGPVAFEVLNGEIQGKTDLELLQIAVRLLKSNYPSESLKTPHLVFGAILFIKQLGMNLSVIQETGYANGKYFLFGSALRAAAMRAPDFGEDRIIELDRNKKVISIKNENIGSDIYAVAVETRRKGSEVWNLFYFTIDEAENAGLLRNAVWKKYPRDMLQHRAIVRSYRANYADALNNVLEPDGFEDYGPGETRQVEEKKGLDLNALEGDNGKS